MKLQQLTKKISACALAVVCAIGMLPATVWADEEKPTYEMLDYKCVSTTLGGMDLSTDGSTWVSTDGKEALFVFADSSSAKLNLEELGLDSEVSVAEYTGGKKVIYAENADGNNILLDEKGNIYAGIKNYEKCQHLVGDYDGTTYEGWFSYYDVENQKFHICDTTGEIQLSIDYITEYPTNLHFIHFGGYFILVNYSGEIQCVFEPTGKAEILFELPEGARVLLANGVIGVNGTYYTSDWTETTYDEFVANPIIKDTSNRVLVESETSDSVYMYQINGVNIYADSWTGEIWDEYDQKIETEDTGDVTVLYSYEDILMVPVMGSEGCTFRVILPEEDVAPEEGTTPEEDATPEEDTVPETDGDVLTDGDASVNENDKDEIVPPVEENDKVESVQPPHVVEKEIKTDENGSVVEIKLENSNESISLKAGANVIPENSALRVEKIENGEKFTTIQNVLKDNLKENGKLYVFEIDLLDQATDVKIQPNGSLTITIALSEPLAESETATVYRIELDGNKTKMPTRVVDGSVEFDTDHFSTYAIVVNPVEAAQNTTAPDTSDTSAPALWISLMAIGCVALGGVCDKKRTRL